MLLGQRGELVLREGERVADLARADELDQVLLQQVEVQRRVEVEDLFVVVDCPRGSANVLGRVLVALLFDETTTEGTGSRGGPPCLFLLPQC